MYTILFLVLCEKKNTRIQIKIIRSVGYLFKVDHKIKFTKFSMTIKNETVIVLFYLKIIVAQQRHHN